MKKLLLLALVSLFLVSCSPYGLGYKEAREAIQRYDVTIIAMDVESLGSFIYFFNGEKNGRPVYGSVQIKSNAKDEKFWYFEGRYTD